MNITGKVIQVAIDVDVKKKDGGTYKGWKLVYEQADGEVKTIQKHMNSLKYAAPLANGLKELKAGDTFTMEMEKEGDFWNPKSIFKGEATTSVKQPDMAMGVKPTTTSSGSTYATKEERAQTQKYIVRQSSITAALKLIELRKEKPSAKEIVDLAEFFETWVMGYAVPGVMEAEKAKLDPFEDLDDDIPY
jgi:hypothetical protein